jgi:hypothetical protein
MAQNNTVIEVEMWLKRTKTEPQFMNNNLSGIFRVGLCFYQYFDILLFNSVQG